MHTAAGRRLGATERCRRASRRVMSVGLSASCSDASSRRLDCSFLEDLPRDVDGGRRSRPAGIEGNVCDELCELSPGHAVLQRELEWNGSSLVR